MNFLRTVGNMLRFDRANWKAVTLCILAASIFWLFNAFNKNYSTNINFPVRFEYDQEKFVPAHALPDQISINVGGNGWDLLRNQLGFKLPTLSISVDRPLETKKIVTGSLLGLLQPQVGKLQINFLVTDTLWLKLDEKDFHKYKVVVDWKDFSFQEGFGRISPIVVLPDSVTLNGPKSALHEIPDSISVSISGNRVTQNFNEEVEVLVSGENIDRIPLSVKVLFEVGSIIEVKARLKLTATSKKQLLPDSVVAWFRIPTKREEEFRLLLEEISASLPSKKPQQIGMMMPRVNKLPAYAQLVKIDSVEVRLNAK